MALRNFYNKIRGLKVKELPSHLKPLFALDYVKKAINKALDDYHRKYILTSSPDPIYHVVFGLMIISYLVHLPEERRHLEEGQRRAKERGGH